MHDLCIFIHTTHNTHTQTLFYQPTTSSGGGEERLEEGAGGRGEHGGGHKHGRRRGRGRRGWLGSRDLVGGEPVPADGLSEPAADGEHGGHPRERGEGGRRPGGGREQRRGDTPVEAVGDVAQERVARGANSTKGANSKEREAYPRREGLRVRAGDAVLVAPRGADGSVLGSKGSPPEARQTGLGRAGKPTAHSAHV